MRYHLKKHRGFTIVELLIVIVVIAVLASIATAAYTNISARARDSIRKQDLSSLAKAIQLYHAEVGDHAEAGCGNGTGTGWLHSDYDGTGPYVSINNCLTGKGPHSSVAFLERPLVDPSGKESCSGTSCTAYMKASCPNGTWVMAHLETLPQNGNETDAICTSTWDTTYGINYLVKVN